MVTQGTSKTRDSRCEGCIFRPVLFSPRQRMQGGGNLWELILGSSGMQRELCLSVLAKNGKSTGAGGRIVTNVTDGCWRIGLFSPGTETVVCVGRAMP